jgi:2-methylcitrate dehydratase PrpD
MAASDTSHARSSDPTDGAFVEVENEEQSMTVAKEFASHLLGLTYEDLPKEAIDNAKKIIVSTLSSAAVGTTIRSAQIVREIAQRQGGQPEATAWFSGGRKLPLTSVVRGNAMLSDAAASDDSDLRNIAHIGTLVTSASFAVAEKTGADGRDILAAIVAGYEASGRIGGVLWPGLGERGFHASVIVAFGGVVAASRLFGLGVEQTAEALSLVATTVGGLTVSTHSWAREYHAGNAALTATNAVLAAREGFSANPDTFESAGGFFDVFGARNDAASVVLEGIGEEWDICKQLAIKIWPGAMPLAAAVEAAINAAKEGDIRPEEVARIEIAGPRFRSLYGYRHPRDLAAAVHSTAYYLAAGIVDRDFNWSHVSMEKVRDPTIAGLQDLVEAVPDMDPSRHTWEWGATVTIILHDGRRYASTVNAPKGSGPRGIDWADIERKARSLLPQSQTPPHDVERILELGRSFEKLKGVESMIALLASS